MVAEARWSFKAPTVRLQLISKLQITTSIDESDEYYENSRGYHRRDDFERGEEFDSAFTLR